MSKPWKEILKNPVLADAAERERLLLPALEAGQAMRYGEDFAKTRWDVAKSEAENSIQPCPKCGQVDSGQTGEYSCSECGLPTLHDAGRKIAEGK